MTSSLRFRLTSAITIVVFFTVALLWIAFIHYEHKLEASKADFALRHEVSEIKTYLENGMNDLDKHMIKTSIDPEYENLAVIFTDDNGRIVKKYGTQGLPSEIINDENWRMMRFKTKKYTVMVGLPWKARSIAVDRTINILGIVGFAIVLTASAGSWILIGQTLSPIKSLSKQVKASLDSDIKISLKATSSDTEFVELVETFNALLHKVSIIADSKTKFCNAASHELRTPIQALIGNIDVALSRERTKEEYMDFMKKAHYQARRITHLVRDLLMLNELEMHTSQPPVELVNLSDTCKFAISELENTLKSRLITVCMDIPQKLEISAVPSHIEVLFRNIIENAAKYATIGGGIYVELHSINGKNELRVFNDFQGDIKLDSEVLFEPFSRTDSSRNSKTGGNGLGLAICKAITNFYGWTISLNQNEIGVSVNIRFYNSS